jgi:hypothetical protein
MMDIDLRPDIDYPLWHALQRIKGGYGAIADVSSKRKALRKFGRNEAIGATPATVMTLPTGETEETLPSTNVNLVISSTSASDTQNLTLIEGHEFDGDDMLFRKSTTLLALTGQTSVDTGFDWGRVTRVRLSSAAVGTIYVHEGGATTNGVPDDLTTVHAIIPAGETQTQKASTTISSTDFYIITAATLAVLEKQAGRFAQSRIEVQPVNDGQDWYPLKQYVSAEATSGTTSILGAGEPALIVPPNHDVRLTAISGTEGVDVVAGMAGYLARVDRYV